MPSLDELNAQLCSSRVDLGTSILHKVTPHALTLDYRVQGLGLDSRLQHQIASWHSILYKVTPRP
jgi:hypothetical protein